MSSIWLEVCSILGISRIKTTSFHPQSNWMIERFHCSLKSFEFSPLEAVYGSNLSLPGKFLEHSELPPEGFLLRLNKQSRVSLDLLDIM